MSKEVGYHEHNYQDNAQHYKDHVSDGSCADHAKTWLETDTVDAWRHSRMYHTLDPLLEAGRTTWLTIGDGRYGKDSRYLQEKGVEVLATDICDLLLKEARDLGFITKFAKENAESLSFADASFDYAFCKESYHHFPRPMLALYEMLRVSSKGVVLIEPNDYWIGRGPLRQLLFFIFNGLFGLIGKRIDSFGFEEFGNFVYTISRRELEKVALAMNYRYLAFKGINDCYVDGVEFEKVADQGPILKRIKRSLFLQDLLSKLCILDHSMLVSVLFKEEPDIALLDQLERQGFDVVVLPVNPFAHGQ